MIQRANCRGRLAAAAGSVLGAIVVLVPNASAATYHDLDDPGQTRKVRPIEASRACTLAKQIFAGRPNPLNAPSAAQVYVDARDIAIAIPKLNIVAERVSKKDAVLAAKIREITTSDSRWTKVILALGPDTYTTDDAGALSIVTRLARNALGDVLGTVSRCDGIGWGIAPANPADACRLWFGTLHEPALTLASSADEWRAWAQMVTLEWEQNHFVEVPQQAAFVSSKLSHAMDRARIYWLNFSIGANTGQISADAYTTATSATSSLRATCQGLGYSP